ncbi:MAG: hypothetical protein VCD66_20405 [Alphaproteobacteria bacterium]|jgi:hypothetical protein
MTDNHQGTGFAIHDIRIGEAGRRPADVVTLDGVLAYLEAVCGRNET